MVQFGTFHYLKKMGDLKPLGLSFPIPHLYGDNCDDDVDDDDDGDGDDEMPLHTTFQN